MKKCLFLSLCLFCFSTYSESRTGFFKITFTPMEHTVDISELPDSCEKPTGSSICPVKTTDLTFSPNATITATNGIMDLGIFSEKSWLALDTVPAAGYQSSVKATYLHGYAVKTPDQKYAAIYFSYQSMGAFDRAGYEWIYQPNGLRSFRDTRIRPHMNDRAANRAELRANWVKPHIIAFRLTPQSEENHVRLLSLQGKIVQTFVIPREKRFYQFTVSISPGLYYLQTEPYTTDRIIPVYR